MSDYLIGSVRTAIGEDLDDTARVYVIFDEMGGQLDALRAVCRLAMPKTAGPNTRIWGESGRARAGAGTSRVD